MIKQLQNRFILISMLSVLLVLTIIIGAINILNYQKVVQDAKNILTILAENNGTFPNHLHLSKQKNPDSKNNSSPSDLTPRPEDAFEKNDPTEPPTPPKSHTKNFSPEMPYETRYFSILLNEDGTIFSTDTGKIAAIDPDTASLYATKVWNSKKDSGFLSSYRYLKKTDPEKTRIIFLDCTRSLSTFRSFLLTSILVSALGLFSVLILVLFFSRIVMKPVSESYEKQRQFITDAGHEIKTPLTIIDANREILEMEYGENEWFQGIQKQTARLASLTNQLIYLSRMEEPKNQVQKIDFSISDLAEEIIQSFLPLAATQEKIFSTDIAPLLSFHGDEPSVRQLISILLDNAIKYSPPQGTIEVTLKKRGKNICFTIYNTTKQISQEQLPHLFDRFYRTDASRNSETGGYGIGLSIAHAVTKAHKGKITAESKDGCSLLVTVIL